MKMMQTLKPEARRSAAGQRLYDDLQALPSGKRLSAGQLEVIYALAYAQFTQGQYAQALPVFGVLSIYGPTRQHYIAGLALCLQMCKRHEDAINVYSMQAVLFPGSPEPALRVAECLLALGRAGEAREELERALRCIAETGGAYDALKARAEMLLGLAVRQS
jgi:type III secretion system low calcium response chaperone LcrH/SycD